MGTKPQINPEVRSIISSDGAILMDLHKGVYYSLNGVGAKIWARLQEGDAVPDILSHLSESFPIPLDQLRSDLDKFILSLEQKGLIRANAQ